MALRVKLGDEVQIVGYPKDPRYAWMEDLLGEGGCIDRVSEGASSVYRVAHPDGPLWFGASFIEVASTGAAA